MAPKPATAHVAPAVLDAGALSDLEALDDTGALLSDLIAIFLGDGARHVQTIRDAVLTRDTMRIRHAAHTMKGGGAFLGATDLVALCARFERLARGGTIDETLVAPLELEFERAAMALRAYQRGGA